MKSIADSAKVTILFLCTAFLAGGADCSPPKVSGPGPTHISAPSGPPLSVQETLDLATTQYFCGRPQSDVDKLVNGNPAALPELYRMLDNAAKKDKWGVIINSVGYFGSEDDSAKLMKILDRVDGSDVDDFSIALAIPDALALIKYRTGANVDAELSKLASMSFWKKKNFKMPGTEANLPTEVMIPKQVIISIDYRNKPMAEILAKRLRAEVADPKIVRELDTWFDHCNINAR